MVEEKKLKEAEERTKRYLRAGVLKAGEKPKFVRFFLTSAENSLDVAKAVYALSTEEEKRESLGFARFDGFLWVINASYYSMFYMARALLESEGVRVKTALSVHAVTFDAFVRYFYLTGRLQKRLVEEFAESQNEAGQLLGREKAGQLVEDYLSEKRKRGAFTYEMGVVAVQAKAKMSLERAAGFSREIRKLLKGKRDL